MRAIDDKRYSTAAMTACQNPWEYVCSGDCGGTYILVHVVIPINYESPRNNQLDDPKSRRVDVKTRLMPTRHVASRSGGVQVPKGSTKP